MSLRVQCSFCPRIFGRKSKCFQHASKDHLELVSNQWMGCDKCKNFFPNSNDLESHKKSVHSDGTGTYAVQCQFCEKKYNNRQNYYLHVNKMHRKNIEETWFFCERCDNYFPTLEILQNHENNSHDDQKMRTCPFCPKVMTRMSVFYKHANDCHKDQLAGSWFSCDACMNYYPSKSILDKHKLSTHANTIRTSDRIKCDFCPKQLNSTYAYYTHANKEHLYLLNGRWFCCEECQKFFPNKPVLDSHKSTVHSKGDLEKRRAEKVTCEFCNQTLRNRATYYKHTNRVHPQQLMDQWQPCQICQMYYPNLEVLEKHKRQRHQPDRAMAGTSLKNPVKIKCKFCPRTFNGNIWYYKHANIAHFNLVADRWVLCEKCETYVPSDISLKRHQRKYHAETVIKSEIRVHCKFCPKMFITNSVYFLHANRAHHDSIIDKWLLCSICQRFYPSKKDLDVHKCRGPPEDHKVDTRSHFVQCGFCNLIENNASAFYKHANKEHQPQLANSNWVMCPICQNFYPDKEVLRSHKKHSHDRALQPKLIKCKYCSLELPDHDAFYRHANTAHLMGLLGKWFFCVRCQYFYPNRTVLENHQSDDHAEVAKVILVHNLKDPNGGLASIGSSGNVTIVHPSEAADTLNMTSKTSKDSIIVLANPNGSRLLASDGNENERTQCSFCEKGFAERHHFINHANKVHHDQVSGIWLSCDTCSKYFPDENVLSLHNSHTHNKGRSLEAKFDEAQTIQMEEMDGETLIKLVCDFCPKSFKHRSYYFCHANKAHPEQLAAHWKGCDECDKRYPTNAVLASHKARFHRFSKPTEADATKQFYVVKAENKTPKKRGKMKGEYDFLNSAVVEDFWTEMETDIQNFSVVTVDEQHQVMEVGQDHQVMQVGQDHQIMQVGQDHQVMQVGQDHQIMQVGQDHQVMQVGQDHQIMQVGQDHQVMQVGQDHQIMQVGQDHQVMQVGQGHQVMHVGQGHQVMQVGQGHQVMQVGQDHRVMQVGQNHG